MAESLFDQNNTDEIQFEEGRDYLSEQVGEGRKYKDNQELAKGNIHANHTINILKTRMDQLRSDFMKERETSLAQTSLQELNAKLEALQASLTATPPANQDEKLGIKPEEFSSLFSQNLALAKEEEKSEANYRMVKNRLAEQFGKNSPAVLQDKSNKLGLSPQFVENLARTSPDAFFNTFEMNQVQNDNNFQAPPRSSMRTDFTPNVAKRTYSYYESLRQKDPNAYYDPKIANQMMDDAFRYGEAFYD